MREYLNAFVPVGPIHMVLTDKIAQTIREKKRRYPFLPDDANVILRDLFEMNAHGGVPAVVHRRRDGAEQLLLYTPTYFLALYTSPHGDGYNIGYVDALNLVEHERLSKGALRVQAQYWQCHRELKDIPQGNSNFWDVIQGGWQHFEQQRQLATPEAQQEELTLVHEHYLDLLEDLVDVTHQLEQDKENLNVGIAYRSVEAAGEVREAPRDIYVFRLVEIPQLNEKSMLRIRGETDLRGRVQALEGLKLTLKFESLVDRRRIPETGVLEPMASSLIYNKQREALTMLRERQARNTHLLPVLVDHHYLPYHLDTMAQERDPDLRALTAEQFEAFRRALTVPDMLMVLGPPGTGKTRTITEIARHCGFRGKSVLVTSGTHKAVDNVLERMPEDLIVIRVGHESNVSEKMRPQMIDAQAETMQRVMLEKTENRAYRLGPLLSSKDEIDALVRQLTKIYADLASNEEQLRTLSQQVSVTYERILAPFKQRYNELESSLRQWNEVLTRAAQRFTIWSQRRIYAEGRLHLFLLGWLFQFIFAFSTARVERVSQVMQEKKEQMGAARNQQLAEKAASQRALLANVQYQQSSLRIQQLTAQCEQSWEALLKLIQRLEVTVGVVLQQPPALTPKGAATLRRYLNWFNDARGKLESEARLLQDWRNELAKPTEQLYPELLRYANVVGATCIGAATARGLEAVDFDLAIVDEAGQICLPDLLVPLVRAQRAVLVGDHHQLPPFVDSDVQQWLKDKAPEKQALSEVLEEEEELQQIHDILTKSAFELLFTAQVDPSHIVRFTMQGRMPQVIADFSSQHFYANRLGTFSADRMGHTVDRDDPLFPQPLTVIDLSDIPEPERWERSRKASESLGETGYTNRAEAQLIAQIAEIYQRAGKEWVVIVPYRAQARQIIQELGLRIEAQDFSLEERVATVDSFQGGERKKVIYGFTRSNRNGRIGFLKELRRLNVAMTRAQQNIILIGDFATLTNADDPRFRTVLSDLYSYARQRGEVLTFATSRKRLRDALP